MRSFRELIQRVRAWRPWRALRRAPVPQAPLPLFVFDTGRPLLREVTPTGVRVYSLCGDCGATLHASATLCDACARARTRSAPNY